jgi:hypothetical protein
MVIVTVPLLPAPSAPRPRDPHARDLDHDYSLRQLRANAAIAPSRVAS